MCAAASARLSGGSASLPVRTDPIRRKVPRKPSDPVGQQGQKAGKVSGYRINPRHGARSARVAGLMLRQREVAAMELAVHSSKNITVALNMNRAKGQHYRACWF